MSGQSTDISTLISRARDMWRAGRLDAAIDLCRQVTAIDPENHTAYGLMGICARRQGNLTAALEHIQTAVRLNPDQAAYHNTLGNIYKDLGRMDQAMASFEQAVRIDPGFGMAYSNLAIVLRHLNRLEEAEANIKTAARYGYQTVGMYNELALILHKLGKGDEADQACRRALALDPDSIDAHKNLAVAAKWKGDTQTAEFHLRKALALDPLYAEGYYVLSDIEPLSLEDPLFDTLSDLVEKDRVPDKDKIFLHFALAASYHKHGKFDHAFGHFQKGNRLRLKTMRKSYDPGFHEQMVSTMVQALDADFFARRRDWGLASETPVFILGMPRSGTTLVEQILSSHSRVHGAGELPKVEELATTLYRSWQAFASDIQTVTQIQINRLALTYLEHIHALSPQAFRITDKMPFNFFFVWFIRLMFPYARIIHCKRNPLDTCLSCYMQNFAEDLPFSCDLTYLKHYFGQYDRIMQHWNGVLSQPMLEVEYEAVISNQEEQTRRILEFCGLDWQEQCLSFHKSTRRVNTASALQVRKGIYTSAMGRWKRYEKHLQDWVRTFHPTDSDQKSQSG